ncbi:MAG: DUF2017 family protein [Actinomycetota bacterium]|nr:DUF2017 family protein [Actinomycetota bacterium]MEE2806069.1 DUF2017 family protein [Actinomycetota bacterium]|tara:strand:+ start:7856 stop:8296 length:441 start_codon:yes stop_codon:yes gene_type:complete
MEVKISDDERRLLGELIDQLRELLLSTSPEGQLDPSLRRLYPAAYVDDVRQEQEYQRSTRDQLLERRLAHLDVVEATINDVELNPDSVTAWITTVNDLRLVLGTQLDVSEDDEPRILDPEDPQEQHRAIYHYLSHLLGEFVEAGGD